MPDDSRTNQPPQRVGWTTPLLGLAVVGLMIAVTGLVSDRALNQTRMETRMAAEMDRSATAEAGARQQIERMTTEAAQREAEGAARDGELRQREAAIAGRENAATERTESSFQGLLIQQQLTKNLEVLKASLPDMTPEVERLAREHAQAQAERQRLQKENAELRRRVKASDPLESR